MASCTAAETSNVRVSVEKRLLVSSVKCSKIACLTLVHLQSYGCAMRKQVIRETTDNHPCCVAMSSVQARMLPALAYVHFPCYAAYAPMFTLLRLVFGEEVIHF